MDLITFQSLVSDLYLRYLVVNVGFNFLHWLVEGCGQGAELLAQVEELFLHLFHKMLGRWVLSLVVAFGFYLDLP
jgi:hypothetical protein